MGKGGKFSPKFVPPPPRGNFFRGYVVKAPDLIDPNISTKFKRGKKAWLKRHRAWVPWETWFGGTTLRKKERGLIRPSFFWRGGNDDWREIGLFLKKGCLKIRPGEEFFKEVRFGSHSRRD